MTFIDDTYATIETAPRDGTAVYVAHEDVGRFIMQWNPEGQSALYPDIIGLWETPCKSMTWVTVDGHGPSHWKPCDRKSLN